VTDDEPDINMEFFRITTKAVSAAEEIKMGIKAALEAAFGEDAKMYGRGVIGWTENDES
jgi:hypothetical protein